VGSPSIAFCTCALEMRIALRVRLRRDDLAAEDPPLAFTSSMAGVRRP
jgi:hypothetical protein